MKTSISMATYNGAAYLHEQLQSFVTQTHRPNEVVVCDDNSSDKSSKIFYEYADNAPFQVNIFRNQKQLGYSLNFNKSLDLSSGEIVFLSDQDDVWFDNKIATVLTVFEQNPQIYLIIHDLSYCDEALRPVGQTKLERMKSIGAGDRSYVTGMATAVKKEFLDICLPIPAKQGITHDLWLHECAYSLGIKKVIPDVLAWYRRHDKNATKGSVINRGKKTHFFSFIRKQNIDEAKVLVERRILLLQQLIEWTRRDDVVSFCTTNLEFNGHSLNMVRKKMTTELEFAQRRVQLYRNKRFTRIFYAVKLYLEGGYTGFMGAKSLLKDVFF